MEEDKRFELEEAISELESQKARHTELITVYVPAGYDLNNVQKQLEQEKSTAGNIKSKTTQKNVIDALESIIRRLKLMKGKPEKGLAIFAGNVAEKEGQKDLKIWVIEPPVELGVRLYRCDQTFVLEPLKEILEVKEVYGIIVIDRNEATLGLLEGKRIITLQHMTSGVPGKTEKGGQSAARYARIREGMAKEFFRRVSESVKNIFFDMKKLKGIIVAGPGPTKEDFLKEGQLVTALKEKVIAIKDIGYADPQALELAVEASKDVLAEQEITREKKLLEDFFNKLGKERTKVVYGMENVKKAMEIGAVETLILSKKIGKNEISDLRQRAENISAKVELVSEETEEGVQFRSLGGIGAVLRFQIQ